MRRSASRLPTSRCLGVYAVLLALAFGSACRAGAPAPSQVPRAHEGGAVLARTPDTTASRRSAVDSAGAAARVEILWDTWGVPHIFAEDRVAMAYAFG